MVKGDAWVNRIGVMSMSLPFLSESGLYPYMSSHLAQSGWIDESGSYSLSFVRSDSCIGVYTESEGPGSFVINNAPTECKDRLKQYDVVYEVYVGAKVEAIDAIPVPPEWMWQNCE